MTIHCELMDGSCKSCGAEKPDKVHEAIFPANIPEDRFCDVFYFDYICTAFLDCHSDADVFRVYGEGFSAGLLAFIKACSIKGKHVIVMHYDSASKHFWCQGVV